MAFFAVWQNKNIDISMFLFLMPPKMMAESL
jgi:hypothetical protein